MKAFKAWRSQRESSRARTPSHLRKMAVVLCDLGGEEFVRKKLGLSSSQLWRWKRELSKRGRSAGVCRGSKAVLKVDDTNVQKPQFVEIASTHQFYAGSIRVEYSRGDGSKMKLLGLAVRDTAVLIAEFLSQETNQDRQR